MTRKTTTVVNETPQAVEWGSSTRPRLEREGEIQRGALPTGKCRMESKRDTYQTGKSADLWGQEEGRSRGD